MPEPTSAKQPPRDSLRETAETIVFVVVLVLMLKLFVVEAFVIPTGSMAETLYGYNREAICPDCGFNFPVNASYDVEPNPLDGKLHPVTGATCPNCRFSWNWKPEEAPSFHSGDRVLVHKAVYALGEPEPGDVVVFKYPVEPQIKHTAQNYIKRLWGRGGETIAIHRGDLFRHTGLTYPEADAAEDDPTRYIAPDDPLNAWQERYTHHRVRPALEAFDASRKVGYTDKNGFTLIRKSDSIALAMRRIVYDNDHQSRTLVKSGIPPRWTAEPESGWKADTAANPRTFSHSGDGFGWVRYLNRISAPATDPAAEAPNMFGQNRGMIDDWDKLRGGSTEGLFPPGPIVNFLGYNAGNENGFAPRMTGDYWVGDLMVECSAKVGGSGDTIVLELSKGVNRYQAKFHDGKVTLTRTGPGGGVLAERPTSITSSGTYDLRFANFDSRLRVWVNNHRIDFGTDADYAPREADGTDVALAAVGSSVFAARPDGHTLQNDILAPVRIGSQGSVEVSKLVIWEDTYFTPSDGGPADSVDTYYVRPGHYLCLGDNSGQSSDSRKWGVVPDRLMLGKAIFVFAPVGRIGFIR